MYQKILVPVDGSAPSLRGLHEAARLAKGCGASLKLVHVVNEFIFDPVYVPATAYEPVLESMRINGQRILATAAAIAREDGAQPETQLIETIGGSVARLILEAALQWRADLIVMGTHGRRGVSRAVLGSDAETVLRKATVPVLFVRDHSQNP
ncbi:MAG TPA: universal stress protein [Povalibacter sp.]|uniref:universal stress protein n=1 Tax=Povalibacter sp. TaxID=1962978 RepID=UPI002CC51336|nr:universal stress protein [Povalibacter sp.]HMN46361.1 universal stress protein [Povalibacter sp.]